ncbi:MAG: hypothetical protein IJV72_01450 [Clostridia bacterium]|nr:hypothetical protein [Clostridia bacterium]
MLFYRIVGALILAFSGFYASVSMNSRLTNTLKQTEAIITLMLFIRSQVECFALPSSEMIALCDRALLRECGFEGDEPPTDICALFDSFGIADSKTAQLARSFAESFGRCYREEQIKECDYYIELFRDRRQILAEALPAKKRVNSTLCISSAIALIILFL